MRWRLAGFFTALLFLLGSGSALAHGVVISYTAAETGEIELQGAFDTGALMAEAQVTIYSPADPAKPWLTGVADEEGRFVFKPDRPGTWAVQFRKGGHGDIVHIVLEEIIEEDNFEGAAAGQTSSPPAAGPQRLAVAGSSSGLTTAQILLMSGSIIWGFIGTALFFARGRSK